MKLKDLKNGMVVVDRFNADLFTIVKVDIDEGVIILRLIGSTCHKNFGGNFFVPIGRFSYNYSIIYNLMYNNELYIPSKVNKPNTPSKVYVVTTIIQEGMEFEGGNYCSVFSDLEKARQYFEDEKKKWFNKLVKRYDGDGDKVTIYNVDNSTCEVYAQDDYQDCVTISLEEKSVQ